MGYDEEDSNKISSRERRRQRKSRHDSEDEVSEIDSEREERKRKKSKRKNDEDKEHSSPDRKRDRNKKDRERDTTYGEERKKAYDNEGYDNNDRGKSRKKKKRRRDQGKVSTIELKNFNDSSLKYDAAKQDMNGDVSQYFKSFFEPEYSDDVADRIAYIKRRVSTSHQCYKLFLKFCRVVQGLLAGICLWEIVVIYGGGMPSLESFVTFYSPIAVAFQATYSVFIAICLIFIGDRLVCRFMTKSDIDPLPIVWRIFSWTTLAGLVYFVGFVLSLVQAPVDLSIHLAVENVTHWLEYTDNAQTIRSWKIGTLFRCLCGIFAFIFITFEPAITFS